MKKKLLADSEKKYHLCGAATADSVALFEPAKFLEATEIDWNPDEDQNDETVADSNLITEKGSSSGIEMTETKVQVVQAWETAAWKLLSVNAVNTKQWINFFLRVRL